MIYKLTASINQSRVIVTSINHYILFILQQHLKQLGVSDVKIEETLHNHPR